MDDPRFKKFLKDPRSRNIPKNVRKIKVDKRFQNMFDKKNFKGGSKGDERGRKLELASSENLKKLYNYESEDSSSVEEESKIVEEPENENDTSRNKGKESKLLKKQTQLKKSKGSDDTIVKANVKVSAKQHKKELFYEKEDTDEEDESSEEDESEEQESGEQETSDEESEEEDSDESENSDDGVSDKTGEFDHRWEETQNEAPDASEITNRLAVCNMDWDRIRAEDLFTVFNSFKPLDGAIQSVRIYPSEFGAKRMEDEKLNGPSELVEETLDPEEEVVEDKKGSKYHIEKLRQYQMNRLKYFYAVVECDTPQTADHLYEQLNGMEYESSSVRFDLRFIPDDVTFDKEPTSEAAKPPDPTEYKPRLFVTSALQQVKVNLTWDETDPKRRETLQKAFTEPESIERDIKSYLASSSGESEVEESEEEENESGQKLSTEERIAKYKALLQGLEEKEKNEEDKYEMEITWNPDLKEKTEEIVKQKMEETDNPFDEIVKKQKERKLKKKEKKAASKKEEPASGSESDSTEDNEDSNMDNETDSKKLDELYLLSDSRKLINKPDQKSKKRKKDKKAKIAHDADFHVDVNDPRFSAIYTSHEYNIDPSDPHFKETEGTKAFVQEKQKRLKTREGSTDNVISKKHKRMKYT